MVIYRYLYRWFAHDIYWFSIIVMLVCLLNKGYPTPRKIRGEEKGKVELEIQFGATELPQNCCHQKSLGKWWNDVKRSTDFSSWAQELHRVVVRMSSYLNLRVVHAAQKEIRGLEVQVKNIKRQHHQHSMPWICDICPVFTCPLHLFLGHLGLGSPFWRNANEPVAEITDLSLQHLEKGNKAPKARVFADEAVTVALEVDQNGKATTVFIGRKWFVCSCICYILLVLKWMKWELRLTGANGWQWMGMGGNGWEWMGMDGNGIIEIIEIIVNN